MGTRYPAHGPIDIISGSNAAAIHDDLKTACLKALELDRKDVLAYAERFSWCASAEPFVENCSPVPTTNAAAYGVACAASSAWDAKLLPNDIEALTLASGTVGDQTATEAVLNLD